MKNSSATIENRTRDLVSVHFFYVVRTTASGYIEDYVLALSLQEEGKRTSHK